MPEDSAEEIMRVVPKGETLDQQLNNYCFPLALNAVQTDGKLGVLIPSTIKCCRVRLTGTEQSIPSGSEDNGLKII